MLPLLPPGVYEVTMELSGFGTFKQMVRSTVGATTTLNPTLQLAGVQEQVTVRAEAPVIETSAPGADHHGGRGRHRQPPHQRPPLPGLRHAHADRPGRYQPRPVVVRRAARHQCERQHRRRRLQPAVFRRRPRRRAFEQRVYHSAGSDPGVPGRGIGVFGGIRPLHRRAGERDHEVRDQRPPRDRCSM